MIDRDGKYPCLCVESKGLHTVEHYLLGRFFLQTQVIFNRKVRFLDLLFADVMEYMATSEPDDPWHLMNLAELLSHVRNDSKGNLHKIYEYTDAQVFVKMRQLHDILDQESVLDDQKSYINDCIKIIMDGQVPEPVETHQKLVDLSTSEEKDYKTRLQNEANKIGTKIAKKLDVDEKRVMVNVIDQEVMKYQERDSVGDKVDEETNREAVRITFRNSDGEDKRKFAAKSNATILGGLIDRALLIFNVFYIQDKHETPDDVEEKGKSIKEAFKGLVSTHFHAEIQGCGCISGQHMCQIVREQNGLEQIKKLGRKPKFICEKCGRVSSIKKYLCKGTKLLS